MNAPVPSIAERCENLPHELDRVFQRALAKDPQPPLSASARELVAELRSALSGSAGTTRDLAATRPRRSPARVIVPLVLLLLAAGDRRRRRGDRHLRVAARRGPS